MLPRSAFAVDRKMRSTTTVHLLLLCSVMTNTQMLWISFEKGLVYITWCNLFVFERYASVKKTKNKQEDLAMSILQISNKKALWIRSYTLHLYTYIHLFVGNRIIIGEFLVPTLNLFAGLALSVESNLSGNQWSTQDHTLFNSLSLWQTTEENVANDHCLPIPTTLNCVIGSAEIDSNCFLSIAWCYPLSIQPIFLI